MTPAKKEKYYAKVRSPLLIWIVRHKIGAVAAHWAFQGLLYMDPTERVFKVALDLLLTLILGTILSALMAWPFAIALALILAHTVNFLFNGQLYGVLKHFGGVESTWEQFYGEVARLQDRVRDEPSIEFAAAYGSLARNEWHQRSDLDVRLVRKAGFQNGLKSCWFALRERTRALRFRFPLDLYVLDGYGSLDRMMEKDEPFILQDKSKNLSHSLDTLH